MSEIRIYVEGKVSPEMREAFDTFLQGPKDRARQKSIQWQIIACGGRDRAYDSFRLALQDHSTAFNVLLVDAEAEVEVYGQTWQHLKKRDNWNNPGTDDNHCHLMVPMMEAWFLADPEKLAEYFEKPFKSVTVHPDVEKVPKKLVEDAMTKVSSRPGKPLYHKIKDGTKLLKSIRPKWVQAKAPHCRRLFETLDAIIGAL